MPTIVMVELEKRKQRVLTQKIQMGDRYQDNDYVCCQKNGLPHGPHSLNKEIRVICENNSLPHITVHGLRHPYVKPATKNIYLYTRFRFENASRSLAFSGLSALSLI